MASIEDAITAALEWRDSDGDHPSRPCRCGPATPGAVDTTLLGTDGIEAVANARPTTRNAPSGSAELRPTSRPSICSPMSRSPHPGRPTSPTALSTGSNDAGPDLHSTCSWAYETVMPHRFSTGFQVAAPVGHMPFAPARCQHLQLQVTARHGLSLPAKNILMAESNPWWTGPRC